MKIQGLIADSVQLAKSDEHPPLIGATMAVHLSQQATSGAVWQLSVDCQIDEGFFRVGSLLTTPPSAGDPASRVVAMAFVPGARGWRVNYFCPTSGEVAEIFISSSHCCGGAFGLTAVTHVTPSPQADLMNRARFVVTTNVSLAAFPVAAGNNDGVTAVQGDVANLPFQTAPSERGPWVVGAVLAGVAPLTRPTWWQSGQAIPSGTEIRIGGEGTVYRDTVWASMVTADSTVVDTSDPVLYPRRLKGASTLANGTVTKGAVPILSASSQVEVRRVLDSVPNLTVEYVVLQAGITPGLAGSFVARGELADGSLNVADQSGITWTILNG